MPLRCANGDLLSYANHICAGQKDQPACRVDSKCVLSALLCYISPPKPQQMREPTQKVSVAAATPRRAIAQAKPVAAMDGHRLENAAANHSVNGEGAADSMEACAFTWDQ